MALEKVLSPTFQNFQDSSFFINIVSLYNYKHIYIYVCSSVCALLSCKGHFKCKIQILK